MIANGILSDSFHIHNVVFYTDAQFLQVVDKLSVRPSVCLSLRL